MLDLYLKSSSNCGFTKELPSFICFSSYKKWNYFLRDYNILQNKRVGFTFYVIWCFFIFICSKMYFWWTFKRLSSSSHLQCSCQHIGCKGLLLQSPLKGCCFAFIFSNTNCVFLLIPQKILMVSCLGFLTAKRLALSYRYTRFGIKV